MIAIELLKNDEEILKELVGKYPDDCMLVTSKKFQGQAETIQVLVSLGAIAIPALANIIVQQIKSKKYVSVKYKGVELQGISEKNAVKILKQLKK